MEQKLFFILLFVGANCLPMILIKDILTQLKKSTNGIQTSVDQVSEKQNETSSTVDQLSASVTEIKKYMKDLHNQSSSTSKIFKHNLDEMQKNLTENTEQLDQKIVSISEDLKKSAVNTKKLQTSVDQLSVEHNEPSSTVDQLSASVTEIKKYMKEEHSKTSSLLETLEQKLDEIQKSHYQFRDDCSDLYNVGLHVSTSYFLQKYNREVKCDMETDGGGWLLIQQRKKVTKQVDFNRNWASYKEGFGDLDTEFWIGNKFLHRITNQKLYELRIDMEDFEKGTFYATYSEFRVGNEESGYQLYLGGYEGNATDSLKIFQNHMKFTTFDRDNDVANDGNCAEYYSGGFWYEGCYNGYLNGLFPTVPDRKNSKSIRWRYTKTYKEVLVLIHVEMKIRPKQYQQIAV